MTQNTHILVHRPMDYIFVMSEGGNMTAYEVLRDGHLEQVPVAHATAQVSAAQKAQLDKGPMPW